MKIAIIGSGISGLTVAHLLCKDYDVTVFEANDYIGGHTHTHEIKIDNKSCLLYTSPSPRDATLSRMPSSA